MKPYMFILLLFAAVFVIQVFVILQLKKKDITAINLPKVTLRINAGIFFLGILMLLIALIYDVNFVKYKAPMAYSNWEKITWADFRAIKRPRETLDGNQNFAFICSEIDYIFKEDGMEVTTYFHPARSYTFNKEIAGKSLMNHELCHLHITEYHARLLRKELTLGSSLGKSKIIRIIEKYRGKERKMQYLYDDETYHGYVLGKQKAWEKRVDSLLVHNKKYSEVTITLK